MKDKNTETGRSILLNLKRNNQPSKVGFGPVSAVVATLLIYLGAQLVAGYLVVQYLFLNGRTKAEIAPSVDSSVLVQFSFILIAEVISLILLWLFLKHRQVSLSAIGLKKPQLKGFLYVFPAYAVYFVLLLIMFVIIQQFIPNIDIDQSQQVGFDNAHGPGLLSLVFVALVILPALVEEIMVRGFLYTGLRKKLSSLKAALLTSLIFGLAHLQLGSGDSPVWIAAIDTFILSLVLVALREKTGNIWAGVVVHMMKNSLAFVTLFLIKPF